MNLAEAHLAVVEHFSKPGARLAFRSSRLLKKTGHCVYRLSGEADDPVRCGVGVLIPNGMYQRQWDAEGSTYVRDLFASSAELCEYWKDIPTGYLEDLQATHDLSPTVKFFLEKLDYLAEKYGISLVPDFPPAVEEVEKELVLT